MSRHCRGHRDHPFFLRQIICGDLFCAEAVLGGVSVMLFGVIAVAGIRMLVESKVDYGKPKNLILTSSCLSSAQRHEADDRSTELKGMVLATIVAIVLSLLFKLSKS